MADFIARFEILKQIGEGGMGAVFRARDPGINRIVAIKLMREGFDSNEMRERFMQEARSAGSLQNPNIVTIFELGEHKSAPFIVMEFIVGEAMNDLIKRRAPLRIARKLELMEALCSGLGYAHRSGIIHRDIKPANLMINIDGILKILDFGIAKVLDYGIGRGAGLTKTGAFIGTPNYMAPEVLCGEPMDHRADIFAVGAVFYELLACQRAFPGASIEAIGQVLHRQPDPLSTVCEGLDPQIDAIVMRALEKSADRRYQDLSDMRRDIARVRRDLMRDSPETLSGAVFEKTLIIKGAAVPVPTQATTEADTAARATAAIAEAERQFEQGQTRDAVERLERFTPSHKLVDEALAALRDRAEELEREAQRAATVERAVESASEAFRRGEYEAAIRFADEALIVNERATQARDLRRRSRTALEEQRRLGELERRSASAIAEARRLFASGDRKAAIDALAAFQPAGAAIAEALDELRAEAAAIEQREREEAARRRREEEAQRLEELAREADGLVESGRRRLAAGSAEEAAADAATALRLVEDHAAARALADEAARAIERARRKKEHDRAAATAVAGSRAAFSAGRHEEAIETLRAFAPSHSIVDDALARLQAELNEIRRQEAKRLEAERVEEAERARAAAAKAEAERRRALEEQRAREEAEAKAAAERAAAREAAAKEAAAKEAAAKEAAAQEAARRERERADRRAREEAAREAAAREAAAKEAAAREAAVSETKEAPTAVATAPAAPVVGRGPSRWIAAAAAGIVGLALVAYEANRLWTPIQDGPPQKVVVTVPTPTGPTTTPAQPATGPTTTTGGQSTPTDTGTTAPAIAVRIDASPWANVTLAPIQPPANSQPVKGTTPLVAELAPGEYNVTLSNPLAPRALTQRITVAAGKDNVFKFTIPGLDPDRIVNEVLGK